MINITWSPPSISNGMILQYIVKRINSSGKSYHYVSRDQNYLELPYFNDALVFVAAVNQHGQSSFEQANSSGKKKSLIYYTLIVCILPLTAPCLPSPCINNGTCVTASVNNQYCVCAGSFSGWLCESPQQVSTENVQRGITFCMTYNQ